MLIQCQCYFLVFIFLVTSVISKGYLKNQIIVNLEQTQSNCVRFLNGTTSVGCQSSSNGNTGTIVQIRRPEDIQAELEQLPLGINNLIALVNTTDLNIELIESLRVNEKVKGIVLLDYGDFRPDHFSEDAACPNQPISVYNRNNDSICHEWNKRGAFHPDGLKFLSFDKPIRFVNNQTEIDLLVNQCAFPFNKQKMANGFRCVGRMKTFMMAAGNAQLCMRRQEGGMGLSGRNPTLCEPLSDRNVFAMLPPLSQKNSTTKADQFVLATRMDTFSTNFDAPTGDYSVLFSIIPLLATAHAIGKNLRTFISHATQEKKQLLFAFFHGESLGYIGSSRWLWEMGEKRFPAPPSILPNDNVRQISHDDLSFFFELQQIGVGEQFYMHTDKGQYIANKTMIDRISDASASSIVHFVDPTQFSYGTAPPSSYNSILKASKNIPGIVLSSFGEGKYDFRYLNSMFDTQIRSNSTLFTETVDRMTTAAQIALNATLTYMMPKLRDNFHIDEGYVENLSQCFFKEPFWNCSLFMGVLNATKDANKRAWLMRTANHLYIGTQNHWESSIRNVVSALLVHSLGEKEPAVNVANKQQCLDQNKKQNVYTFVWQNDPDTDKDVCYRTSVFLGKAESPAFELEDYNFASAEYSTWMESTQTGGTMELYLQADYHLELYAFITAIVVLILSVPLCFLKEQWFIDNSLPPASPQPL